MRKLLLVVVLSVVVILLVAGCREQGWRPTTKQPRPATTAAPRKPRPTPKAPTGATGAEWHPLAPIRGEVLSNGPRTKPLVALTFDACEDAQPAGYDAAIIDILTREQAPATLFLGGKWMRSHPDETRALGKSRLFELANHSFTHPDFTALTPQQMKSEVLRTQETMFELVGRQGSLFRFPFGKYNQQAVDEIGRHGLTAVQWDTVTGDPDPNINAPAIIREVSAKARPGSIIIMHMNKRGWHTAEALPQVIAVLRSKGYRLVTVSELIGRQ